MLVAADQEGGQLVALGDGTTPFAGAMALGATGDEDLAERVAGATARELRALGVNVDYAPVCDLANNPANPALGIRSFGDDPEAVGRLAAATVRGLQGEGVAATVKHFPGAGDTPADPHHELPSVPDDARGARRAGAGPVPGGVRGRRADGHDRPRRAARRRRRPADEPVGRGAARPAARASSASTA